MTVNKCKEIISFFVIFQEKTSRINTQLILLLISVYFSRLTPLNILKNPHDLLISA